MQVLTPGISPRFHPLIQKPHNSEESRKPSSSSTKTQGTINI